MQYNPWPKNVFLRCLAAIWSFPTALVGFILSAILLCFKSAKSFGWKDGALDLVLSKDSFLYKKLSNKFSAFSIGWTVVYLSEISLNNESTRIHERTHLRQQLILSIFDWIFYALFCLVIYVACDLNSYHANPMEIDAKIKANQHVDANLFKSNGDKWPLW